MEPIISVNKTPNSQKGFTLIELMIAVSIIAILVTIAMITYQGINKKARDGKRQADLKIIQGALQHYYADNNNFPLTGSLATPLVGSSGKYLKSLPVDPLTSNNYTYQAKPDDCNNSTIYCSSYCLITTLDLSVVDDAHGCASGGNNFGVSPP